MVSPCRNQLAAVLGILTTLLASTSAYPFAGGLFSLDERCDQQKVVCFISAANVQFNYDTVQPGWCTHYILIDLIVLNSEGKLLVIEQSYPALTQFTELKARLGQLDDRARFLLAIGGVNQDSAHFSRAISDPGRLRKVADAVVAYVAKYCFDGVDVAWFYPGKFGGCEIDKGNLVALLRELRCRLADETSLSVTVGVDPQHIYLAYNISAINEYVDFVNVMSGDYHDPEHISQVAALYPGDPKDRYNVYYSVKTFVQGGIPADKIVVLTSTYGYLYSLQLCNNRGVDYVKSVQKLNNVCIREILEQEDFYTTWDEVRMVPYSTLTRGCSMKWITFNDLESHRHKAEFVRKYDLGGIGSFTMDQDVCEGTDGMPFPFLYTLVKVIRPEWLTRVLPRIVCAEDGEIRSEIPCEDVTETALVNDEDVMIRYMPGKHSSSGKRESRDVPYQSPPEGVTCRPLVITNPPTTTEEITSTDSTTDYISMDYSDSTTITEPAYEYA